MNRNKSGIAYIWFMALAAVVVVALLWFILDLGLGAYFLSLQTMFPDAMKDKGIVFVNSIWVYLPVLALIGIGVWVFVMSQRPENRGAQYA